jgi:hypothetical protein
MLRQALARRACVRGDDPIGTQASRFPGQDCAPVNSSAGLKVHLQKTQVRRWRHGQAALIDAGRAPLASNQSFRRQRQIARSYNMESATRA